MHFLSHLSNFHMSAFFSVIGFACFLLLVIIFIIFIDYLPPFLFTIVSWVQFPPYQNLLLNLLDEYISSFLIFNYENFKQIEKQNHIHPYAYHLDKKNLLLFFLLCLHPLSMRTQILTQQLTNKFTDMCYLIPNCKEFRMLL